MSGGDTAAGAHGQTLRTPISSLLFFLGGLMLTIATLVLEASLLRSHPNLPRPAWVGPTRFALMALPWILACVLLIERVRSRRRVPWIAYGVGALTPWVLSSVLLFGPDVAEYLRRADFDSAAWKAASWNGATHPSEIRLTMVDDLIASGRLDGMKRAAVLRLLGPDDSSKGTGYGQGYFSDWDLVYWLGSERGFAGIDSEWLVIKLKDNHVDSYRIVTD